MEKPTGTIKELGIENLKESIAYTAEFASKIQEAAADGRFTPDEYMTLFMTLSRLPGKLEQFKLALPELKDLDRAEGEELVALVKETLDLEDKKAEAQAEAAVEWMVATNNLLRTFS